MAGFGAIGAGFGIASGAQGINYGQTEIAQGTKNPIATELQTQAPDYNIDGQLPGLPTFNRTDASYEQQEKGRTLADTTLDTTAQKQIQANENNQANANQAVSGTGGSASSMLAAIAGIHKNTVDNLNETFANSALRKQGNMNNYLNHILPSVNEDEQNVENASRQDYLTKMAMARGEMSAGYNNVINGTSKIGNSISSMGGGEGGGAGGGSTPTPAAE